MLKNWLLCTKVRNFIKSGCFIDFFSKKITIVVINSFTKFTVLFLEKFALESLFKTLMGLVPNPSLFKVNSNYKTHTVVGCLLYAVVLLCLLIAW